MLHQNEIWYKICSKIHILTISENGVIFFSPRDRDVIGKIVNCGGIECLVKMAQSEYVVMQTEAFLALHLTGAIRGQDAEPSLLKANIGEVITKFLTVKPQREVFHNLLAFIGQIIDSGKKINNYVGLK